MKVSIVIAILNSHEIFRRQILHFIRQDFPEDVEIILVDDGSTPAQVFPEKAPRNFSLIYTNDFREWTQPAARNMGAKHAKGEYLILTDVDHIISRELVEVVRNTKYDVVRCKREAGVILESGEFTQEDSVLREYGLLPKYNRKLSAHGNSYAIKKDLYLQLGGVSERLVGTGKYPNREEQTLKHRIRHLQHKGDIQVCEDDTRPVLYMFPNGRFCGNRDYNPFDLFHTLSREKWWRKEGWVRDLEKKAAERHNTSEE